MNRSKCVANSPELGGLRLHCDGETQNARSVSAGGVDMVPARLKTNNNKKIRTPMRAAGKLLLHEVYRNDTNQARTPVSLWCEGSRNKAPP